jgi:hypothetical protein
VEEIERSMDQVERGTRTRIQDEIHKVEKDQEHLLESVDLRSQDGIKVTLMMTKKMSRSAADSKEFRRMREERHIQKGGQ